MSLLNYFFYHICSVFFKYFLYHIWNNLDFLSLSRNYTQLQIANEVLLSRGVRDDEFEFQEHLDSLMKMKCRASKGE